MPEPRVGRGMQLLGAAGLIPAVLAVAVEALGRFAANDLAIIPLLGGYLIALGYAAAILSFLGGIWWGFAARRTERQGRLATLAVIPSLIGCAAFAAAVAGLPHALSPWPGIALGSAIMLTLLVDRRLATSGEAPAGWLRLRVPLSVGLGALTIAAGLLVAV